MAKLEHYYTKFEEGNCYHVYNRSIDKQPLFRNNDNYRFFLERYSKYLCEVADLYAYCLLNNHYHLLIRVHESFSLNADNRSAHDIVSHQFRKFFQSYSMAFNKQHERSGTLFQTPFKRALINDDSYFTKIIYYIHSNQQHHNFTSDFRNWHWSSYNNMTSGKNAILKVEEVMQWFGGEAAYKQYHAERRLDDISLYFED